MDVRGVDVAARVVAVRLQERNGESDLLRGILALMRWRLALRCAAGGAALAAPSMRRAAGHVVLCFGCLQMPQCQRQE